MKVVLCFLLAVFCVASGRFGGGYRRCPGCPPPYVNYGDDLGRGKRSLGEWGRKPWECPGCPPPFFPDDDYLNGYGRGKRSLGPFGRKPWDCIGCPPPFLPDDDDILSGK